MKHFFLTLTLFVLLIAAVPVLGQAESTQAISNSTAEYRVVYESSWSAATHPIDYPTNSAHYSRLVGATHNENAHFWRLGELASEGIERMAELGSNGTLSDEVGAAIFTETADQYISGPGLGSGPGTITIDSISVNSDYPLLTLVSMIAPSPDWFVGIDSVPLMGENGRWLEEVTITMYPYDAGTDNGATYTSPNANANPPQVIRDYTGVAPFSTEPMGTLTITRLDSPFDYRLALPIVRHEVTSQD